MTPIQKQDAENRLLREHEAWELRVRKRMTHREIADELGVDHSTVTRMLSAVAKRLAKEFVARAEEIKSDHTDRLMVIYEEAMSEWERSKLPIQVKKETSRHSDKGHVEESTDEERGRIGDARLLNVAIDALSAIRAIWGVDSPSRTEVTGKNGAPLSVGRVVIKLPDNGREAPKSKGEKDASL